MLKILQVRLQQYMNQELPNVRGGFRKGRGTRDKLPTSAGSWKKQESSRKTSISALLTMQIWKPQQWPQDWKRSVFIPIPKKGNA